ncbi:MAG: polysaccharide biosynthesis protein PslG [Actinomycetota bacterium]|nr:polysaccharide biosynthesis protein PslG [Actinomycetota bacterium]
MALVGSLLMIFGAAAPASAATPAPVFGVQFHGTWGDYTDAQRAVVLDALKANGAQTVRIDVSWRMLEPVKSGTFDTWGLAQVDNAINMAAERGLSPMVTLWMAPKWANGSTDELVPVTSKTGLNGLTSVTKRLAIRYKATVQAWEFWNEPNDNNFMRGANPKVYAGMLKAAYSGFKAGSPSAKVVFGGTSYVDDVWVRKALAAGAKGKYDIMGVHPYQGVADEAPELPDNGTMWRMNHLPALIAAMKAYGDGGKQIWFTEFGWRVAQTAPDTANWQRGVSPATQADYLARTIDLIQTTYPQVTRVYWYNDRVASTDANNTGYGMVYPDGSVTPALAGLRAALA